MLLGAKDTALASPDAVVDPEVAPVPDDDADDVDEGDGGDDDEPPESSVGETLAAPEPPPWAGAPDVADDVPLGWLLPLLHEAVTTIAVPRAPQPANRFARLNAGTKDGNDIVSRYAMLVRASIGMRLRTNRRAPRLDRWAGAQRSPPCTEGSLESIRESGIASCP